MQRTVIPSFTKLSVLLVVFALFVAGCSGQKKAQSSKTKTEKTTSKANKKGKETVDKGKEKVDAAKEATKTVAKKDSVDTSESDAFLDETGLWGETSEDSLKAIEKYSLYREFYKQKSYADALPHWRYIFANVPRARKTPLLNGEKMYKSLIGDQVEFTVCKDGTEMPGKDKKACKSNKGWSHWKYKDDALVQSYMDTIYMIYDVREKYYADQAKVATLKARLWSQYKADEKEEIFKLRHDAIEKEQEDAAYDVVYYYFRSFLSKVKAKELTLDSLLTTYPKLSNIMASNIADTTSTQKDKYEKFLGKMDKVMNGIIEKKKAKEEEQAAYEAERAKAEEEYARELEEYAKKVEEQNKKYAAKIEEQKKKYATDSAQYVIDDAELKEYERQKKEYEKAIFNYEAQQRKVKEANDRLNAANDAVVASTVQSASSCSEVVSLYGDKFRSNPGDLRAAKVLYAQLKKLSCQSDPLYLEALTKIVEAEPSGSRYRSLAQSYQKQKNFDKATQLYEKSTTVETDPAKNAKVYYRLAQIAYAKGQKSKARKHARNAAKMKPGWGDPYILIGDMYASTKLNDGIGGRSVLWVAVDMYAKAKEVDIAVASKARSKINRYSASFADKEDLFMKKGLSKGDRYTVGGWIQQSTRIR